MRRVFMTGILAVLATANWSRAAAVAPVSDVLTVFNPLQAIVGQVGVREDGTVFGLNGACNGPTCGTLEDSANVYYINLAGLAGSGTGLNTMLLESDTVGSDVYGIINLGLGYLTLFFRSDSEAIEFLPIAGYNLVPEGNGFFDATPYLNTDLQASGYTAQFFSDPEVPEPGTSVIFGGGMLALVFWRRLRR